MAAWCEPQRVRASRLLRVCLVVSVGILAAITSDVGSAAKDGTVNAQVTVAGAACVQLSTTSVNFGTLALGAENQPGTPGVTITNCTATSESLQAGLM